MEALRPGLFHDFQFHVHVSQEFGGEIHRLGRLVTKSAESAFTCGLEPGTAPKRGPGFGC